MSGLFVITLIAPTQPEVTFRVALATRFVERCRGLIGRASLPENQGLLLWPGGSIHTFGMTYPIDALFLDRNLRVLKKQANLMPSRFSIAPRSTRGTLELAAGSAKNLPAGVQFQTLPRGVKPCRSQSIR